MFNKRPIVFLAVPNYKGISPQTANSILQACNPNHASLCTCIRKPDSLLAMGFNSYWCQALNKRKELGITHFAMIHSDIEAEPNFIGKMLDIQRDNNADLLSVVMPIKNKHGRTSTAICDGKTGGMQRLMMREVAKLPIKTFTISNISADEGDVLCVNTGLWICDFTQPWVEKVWFEIKDSIVKKTVDGRIVSLDSSEPGEFQPRNVPEDWHFSLQIAALGRRICATTAIRAIHIGDYEYPNYMVWGDEADSDEP